MAVRRGVVLVIVLILAAVAVSAAGLVAMAVMTGRGPVVAGNSTLVLQISGDLAGDGAVRRLRPVRRAPADGPFR